MILKLVLLAGALAGAPDPAVSTLSADEKRVLDGARGLMHAGQAAQALKSLEAAGLVEKAPGNAELAGVVAAAAMDTGDAARAEPLLRIIAKSPSLTPLAKAMVDIRLLEVCQASCTAPAIGADDLLQLPLTAQARLLSAMTSRDLKEVGPLASAVKERTGWKQGLPDERATLLLATHAALMSTGNESAARELAILAWETIPAEPALVPVLAPLKDEELIKELGLARAVKHLDALAEANRNEEVIRFGTLLCRDAVTTESAVCPAVIPVESACSVAFSVGKAQRQSRLYEDAEKTLGVVAAQCKDFAPRALFLQARAMAGQSGGSTRAVKAFDAVVKSHPDNRLADDALVLAGQLLARGKGKGAARGYWERCVKQYPEGDQVDEAGWWLAWDSHQKGKDEDAVKQLDALVKLTEKRSFSTWKRAQYWRARFRSDAKDATAIMRELLERAPQSYEAALARGWLQRRGLSTETPVIGGNAEVPAPSDLDAMAKAALALSQVGLDADAAQLFKSSKGFVPSSGTDLWIASQLIRVGDPATASRYVRIKHSDKLASAMSTENATIWRLGYPHAHARAITAGAGSVGMPSQLLFALAREESAFDARVVSWAGAIGLTQLMPATAAMEARATGIANPDLVTLLDPSVNARLGANHLARDLKEFNGNVALALAAYNAGPGAVRTWLKRHGALDLDEFVENIPIEETRGYVKRVLESFSIYLLLTGAKEPLVIPQKPLDRMVPAPT